MRWLIVLPFDRPDHMGVDFRDELVAMGHQVRTFAYRRNNPLYKNRGTKAAYQLFILRRLERLCQEWRPSIVLVINFFTDNPLLMMTFDGIEAYDVFFTKERHALRALEGVGIRNLYYLPMYCVPAMHHPITLTSEEQLRYARPISFVGSRYPYRERLIKELLEFP